MYSILQSVRNRELQNYKPGQVQETEKYILKFNNLYSTYGVSSVCSLRLDGNVVRA